MKKAKRNSLIITITYFSISAIIFSMGGLPDIVILRELETIIMLPAVIGFGFGFGGGTIIGLLAMIIIFLIVWLFCWFILS